MKFAGTNDDITIEDKCLFMIKEITFSPRHYNAGSTRRIVLVNPGRIGLSQASGEPAQLFALARVLNQHNYETVVLDAYGEPDPGQLRACLEKFAARAVGVTTYDVSSSVNYLKKTNFAFDILGGVGTTQNPSLFIDWFHPKIVVRGEGETPLGFLAQNDFSLSLLPGSSDGLPIDITRIGETFVLRARQALSLADLPFDRPFPENMYDSYWIDAQRGCFGECRFCGGEKEQPVRYRSPQSVADEVAYLSARSQIIRINTFGPDFTAQPRKATDIIRALVDQGMAEKLFSFTVRPDTLYRSLLNDPVAWKEFMIKNIVIFIIGFESAVPAKLVKLKKQLGPDNMAAHLDRILLLADHCPCLIQLSWVLFTPESTPAELLVDLTIMRTILAKFPLVHFAFPGNMFNWEQPIGGSAIDGVFSPDWPKSISDDLVKELFEYCTSREMKTALRNKENPDREVEALDQALAFLKSRITASGREEEIYSAAKRIILEIKTERLPLPSFLF